MPPFYQLLRKENDVILTDEHNNCTDTLRKDLEQACQMALKLLETNAQYAILTDSSFYAAGYVLFIEDYATDQSLSGKQYKTYVPVSIGSKIFKPTHLSVSICAKEILAAHFAFYTFVHILR